MVTVIGGRDKTKKDTYMLSVLLNRFERGEIRDDHLFREMQICGITLVEMV